MAAAVFFVLTTRQGDDLALMLNNCITKLHSYPDGQGSAWSQWTSVTPLELETIFFRWRASGVED